MPPLPEGVSNAVPHFSELRGLLEKATKGPWLRLHDNPASTTAEVNPLDEGEPFKLRMAAKPNDCKCAQVWSGAADWPVAYCDTRQFGEGLNDEQQMANAALIAAAVSALPSLLDQLSQVQRERDELREALEPFAAVSAKAKGKDDACWCGQDGAVIRYRDLRAASTAHANMKELIGHE